MHLQLQGITKVFGPLVANDHIDLDIRPGEIHALLGENGAGKSTLMNVLYGLYQPDGGQIVIDGEPVKFSGPGDAVRAGIGMVHQHFMLVPVFTVLESVALGSEPIGALGIIDKEKARGPVMELSEKFGFDLNPDALIEDLPVGARQRVEIIKALSRNAKVLILDEPTAVLTPQEADDLMKIMVQLKEAGTAIVFITHKLREVRKVSDRITVIRRGKVVGEANPASTELELASLMVGRPVALDVKKDEPKRGDVGLAVRNLTVKTTDGHVALDDISFEVAGGEILCIGGVQGNGQTELAQTIIGDLEPLIGTVEMGGEDLHGKTTKQRLRAGLGYVPEDRQTDGLIGQFTIEENMVLDQYDQAPYAKGINMRPAVVHETAEGLKDEFDVRVTSVKDPISTLSGGNAQKAILARELSRPLTALVAAQPTRGLDVGSIEFVYERLVRERDSGTACVVISTELDEVDALADRIAIMYRGKIVGIVPQGTPRSVLGLMMAGVPLEEAQAVAKAQEGEERE